MAIVHDATTDPITELIGQLPTPQLSELAKVHRRRADDLLKRKREIAQSMNAEMLALERDHDWHMVVVQILQAESFRRNGVG